MFKIIGWFIKTTLFAILILILGATVKWDGVTISDQIKTGLAHAEPVGLYEKARAWAGNLMGDAKTGARRRHSLAAPINAERTDHIETTSAVAEKEIPPSERQKLRALIQSLNQPRGKN